MLVGQSLFQSVLTRLDEEDKGEDDASAAPAFRLAGLSAGFVASTTYETAPEAVQVPDSYLELLSDMPPPKPETGPEPPAREPEPPPVPAYLLRLSEAEIAEDLAIAAADTAETLAEKRRRFARNNHPDLVPEIFRDRATLRMKTANLLIDRAVKDLYWRSS
nr:hypothetical protein REQ54_00594 [Rhizobium sp. Q54]